ncbi:MAG: hypothetical protein R6W89_07895 [Candidatus Hydrogenedentota bacterium]
MQNQLNSAGIDNWLKLLNADGVGPITFAGLIKHFGTIDNALGASTFSMENKPESMKVFLNDAYLDTKTELSKATTYDFSVDENIPESVDQNRFNLTLSRPP